MIVTATSLTRIEEVEIRQNKEKTRSPDFACFLIPFRLLSESLSLCLSLSLSLTLFLSVSRLVPLSVSLSLFVSRSSSSVKREKAVLTLVSLTREERLLSLLLFP